jgi:hypothetical protein
MRSGLAATVEESAPCNAATINQTLALKTSYAMHSFLEYYCYCGGGQTRYGGAQKMSHCCTNLSVAGYQ